MANQSRQEKLLARLDAAFDRFRDSARAEQDIQELEKEVGEIRSLLLEVPVEETIAEVRRKLAQRMPVFY